MLGVGRDETATDVPFLLLVSPTARIDTASLDLASISGRQSARVVIWSIDGSPVQRSRWKIASPPVADDFRHKVLAAVRSVGPGQVASYGDIAEQAGFPGSARAVGTLLAASGPEDELPWWRIVTASGRLAPGKEATQARLLAGEGVPLTSGSSPTCPPPRA